MQHSDSGGGGAGGGPSALCELLRLAREGSGGGSGGEVQWVSVHEGWLLKQSQLLKRWRPRYVQLQVLPLPPPAPQPRRLVYLTSPPPSAHKVRPPLSLPHYYHHSLPPPSLSLCVCVACLRVWWSCVAAVSWGRGWGGGRRAASRSPVAPRASSLDRSKDKTHSNGSKPSQRPSRSHAGTPLPPTPGLAS